jgi:hypothetical protein
MCEEEVDKEGSDAGKRRRRTTRRSHRKIPLTNVVLYRDSGYKDPEKVRRFRMGRGSTSTGVAETQNGEKWGRACAIADRGSDEQQG